MKLEVGWYVRAGKDSLLGTSQLERRGAMHPVFFLLAIAATLAAIGAVAWLLFGFHQDTRKALEVSVETRVAIAAILIGTAAIGWCLAVSV